ncbi:EamA family transporter, partial [Mesorhizobium sp. M7A.F.Ca.CA.004.01.1.1]
MAWLRIATAALIFAPLTRPWRSFARADRSTRLLLLAFGACLAVMNCSFYLALDRLPISLVAAIEFVGTIGVAAIGLRSPRNLAALVVAVAGTLLLIDVRWSDNPIGLCWAFLNGALFVGYIVLGHRVAASGVGAGIAGLGAAMAIAFIVVLPIGLTDALPAFFSLPLLFAAIGVGICSSVIPCICDQLAMSRLPRASFALMLSLLPVTATLIGVVVLRQMPSFTDCLGIALVVAGVAFHKPANTD